MVSRAGARLAPYAMRRRWLRWASALATPWCSSGLVYRRIPRALLVLAEHELQIRDRPACRRSSPARLYLGRAGGVHRVVHLVHAAADDPEAVWNPPGVGTLSLPLLSVAAVAGGVHDTLDGEDDDAAAASVAAAGALLVRTVGPPRGRRATLPTTLQTADLRGDGREAPVRQIATIDREARAARGRARRAALPGPRRPAPARPRASDCILPMADSPRTSPSAPAEGVCARGGVPSRRRAQEKAFRHPRADSCSSAASRISGGSGRALSDDALPSSFALPRARTLLRRRRRLRSTCGRGWRRCCAATHATRVLWMLELIAPTAGRQSTRGAPARRSMLPSHARFLQDCVSGRVALCRLTSAFTCSAARPVPTVMDAAPKAPCPLRAGAGYRTTPSAPLLAIDCHSAAVRGACAPHHAGASCVAFRCPPPNAATSSRTPSSPGVGRRGAPARRAGGRHRAGGRRPR